MIDAKKLIQEVLELAEQQCRDIRSEYSLAGALDCAQAIRSLSLDEQAIAALLAKCEEVPVAWEKNCPDDVMGMRRTVISQNPNDQTWKPLYAAPVLPAYDEAGERAKFEAEYQKLYPHAVFNRHQFEDIDIYKDGHLQSAWEGWQISRAALRETGK